MTDLARPTQPMALDASSISRLLVSALADAEFHREGLRENFEYRDLGLAAATGGRAGAKHIRAVKPFEVETGWHWHDMTLHVVYVLKGWIRFRFRGNEGDVVVAAGSMINQPSGVPHNVVGYADDLELVEINMPARYGTFEV